MKKKVLLAISVLLVLIQFFPIGNTNPPIEPTLDFYSSTSLSQEEEQLLEAACNDCHSHASEFPSYTRLQPVGWWIRSHIRGGRINLNFSEWNNYDKKKKDHKLEECIEVLEQGRMPLKSYTWLHPKSKLSEADKKTLIDLFNRLKNSN